MKNVVIIMVLSLSIVSCNTNKKNKEAVQTNNLAYHSFGDVISDADYLSSQEALDSYKLLKSTDTINLKFSSSIVDVCSKKGCWMTLPGRVNDENIMVRFKDYGFFVPLDASGKEVIVEGKAFVNKVSVAELRHYAEDAGKSMKEIAEITEPKIEFAFEANGVLIKK
tara:strand:- start:374 stop:874 length:501 start_codon:yes stop_codon:yes gene_type:complete